MSSSVRMGFLFPCLLEVLQKEICLISLLGYNVMVLSLLWIYGYIRPQKNTKNCSKVCFGL